MSDVQRVSFEKLIGTEVLLTSAIFGNINELHKILLRGVEGGGIWIESSELTDQFFKAIKVNAAPKTGIYFLPYHLIGIAIAAIDLPSMSEKGLGL
jgi:hypothetical protein